MIRHITQVCGTLAVCITTVMAAQPVAPSRPGLPERARPALAAGHGGQPLVPVIPATVLREAADTYRSAVIHERITITLRGTGTPGANTGPLRVLRREEVVLRLQPRSFEPGQSLPEAMQLDLGQVQVWAEGGMLVLTHKLHPGTFYRNDYDPPLGPTAWASLPPLPLPQLAILGYAGEPDDPGPRVDARAFSPVRGVEVRRWTARPIDPLRDDPPEYRLEGQTDAGVLTLVIAAATGRVRSMTVPLPPPAPDAPALELHIEVVPIAPAPIRPPDLSARKLVGSPSELAPPREAPPTP